MMERTCENCENFVPKSKRLSKAEARLNEMMASGLDVSHYFVARSVNKKDGILISIEDDGVHVVDFSDPIEQQIYANGYVKNTQLHRRWVMAQVFKGLNYKSWDGKTTGFDAWLRSHGYEYQWKMLLEELRVQAKIEEADPDAFAKRNRYFDAELAGDMIENYANGVLMDFVVDKDVRRYRGRDYVRLGNRAKKITHKKHGDIFYSDLAELKSNTVNLAAVVRASTSARDTYETVKHFMTNYYVPMPFYMKLDPQFIDAYKGAGAYFTCDNLIKFHKCTVDGGDVDSSLETLNLKASEYAAAGENWRLFGFMKKVIGDNGFNFSKRMAEIYK